MPSENVRANWRRYKERHRDRVRTRERARAARDSERERKRIWARKNRPDLKRAGLLVGKVDYDVVMAKSNGRCGICKKPFDLFGIDFDHIVPLSKGGEHVESNLQATHMSCNRSKGNRIAV